MKNSEIITQFGNQIFNNPNYTQNYKQNTDYLSSKDHYTNLFAQKIENSYSGSQFNKSLNYALSVLDERTNDFSKLLDSYHLPASNNSEYFRTTKISDPEKMDAIASSEASPGSYYIKIENLAQSQISKSKLLSSNSETELKEGKYEFSLKTDDSSLLFSVTLNKEQISTNKDLLQGLETELNSVDTNLNITVQETPKKTYTDFSEAIYEDMSYLLISHNRSGDEKWFQLQDESGGLIDFLDLNSMSYAGQNASFYLNGNLESSPDNSISLDNNQLDINFKEESENSVLLEVKKGEKEVTEQTKQIVDTYNDYLNWLENNHSFIEPGLRSNLADMTISRSKELASIGINVANETARMELTDYFESALRNKTEKVKETLISEEEGLFHQMKKKLQEVLQEPIQNFGNNRKQFAIYTKWGLSRQEDTSQSSFAAFDQYI